MGSPPSSSSHPLPGQPTVAEEEGGRGQWFRQGRRRLGGRALPAIGGDPARSASGIGRPDIASLGRGRRRRRRRRLSPDAFFAVLRDAAAIGLSRGARRWRGAEMDLVRSPPDPIPSHFPGLTPRPSSAAKRGTQIMRREKSEAGQVLLSSAGRPLRGPRGSMRHRTRWKSAGHGQRFPLDPG